MKRWFRVFIISVFAIAAVSLVVIQFFQTRRTFSINDNMFNVGVSNAMDEVISQLNGNSAGTEEASTAFNYKELDSLIVEELLLNGIDIQHRLAKRKQPGRIALPLQFPTRWRRLRKPDLHHPRIPQNRALPATQLMAVHLHEPLPDTHHCRHVHHFPAHPGNPAQTGPDEDRIHQQHDT